MGDIMEEKKNIPEIRFKGFEEVWKELKLGDLSDSLEYGLNAAAITYDGYNKYIRITDIDDDSRLFLKKGLTSPKTNIDLAENYRLKNNDIIFARTGASVGKSYIYKESDGLVYFAGFLIRARINPKVNSYFVFQNTLTDNYKKFIYITSQRSGQPGVNAQEYSNYSFKLPCLNEQSQIGTFFQNLDKQITLEQQKHDKLITLKKAMLEKMFPKEGASVPEIRFEGFEGEWVKKRLEDFCSYHSSNLSYNSVIANGQYELYDANGVIGYSNDYFLDSDYITIIKDGSGVGRVRLLPKNTSFIGTMGAFKVKDSDIRFLLCCLLITDFSKHVIGATIPHIYFSNYGKEEYFVPSIEEQSKIGSYFQNLDNLISLQQQKIDKLKNIKKACLDKMFV